MCPAGINAYHAAGHMGPALQRVSCPHAPPCDFVGDGVPDVPRVRRRGTSLFCLRRVTFVSSDKSHQKRRLKLRFKTSSRASAVISRLPVPRATDFPVFPGSKDCASTAFRDALSRDAARCRGGCLGALPRGYKQIFHHGGRLCPLRTTSAPCRAGPMCPAGINAYHAAGHMGPALQRVSCPHASPCDSVGDGVPDVPTARSAVIPSQCGHWRGNPHPPPAGADNSPAPASRSVSWPCPRRNSCCRTPRAPCTHRTGWPRRECPSSPRWSADPAGRRCRSCRGASR